MTTYWFALASRSELTVLAWLNSAMFGPIATSYQLLNHSAGTPQHMESSYRPPVSHAGSQGPRPLSSSKFPCGLSSDVSRPATDRCGYFEGTWASGVLATGLCYLDPPT